jgi:DNA-binding CsgD family transcriptional regulator
MVWSVNDLGEIAFALGDHARAETLLKEGLRQFDDLGVSFGAYRALVLLADVYRRQALWVQALDFYEQALVRQRQTHFVARCADILEGLAEVAVVLHRPQAAARLIGGGHAWRETFGFPRFAFFEADHERTTAAAEEQLGPKAWSANYGAGRALTSQQASAEAQAYAQDLASAARARDMAGLTPRELEVLRALALGMSSREIADRLVVSPRTVHAHLRSIFGKLDVSTRMAAAQEAARLRLV